MAEYYTYSKKVKDFDKPLAQAFVNSDIVSYKFPEEVGVPKQQEQYEVRNPNFVDLDNIPTLQETSINTERILTKDIGMNHKEGGWPIGVDSSEQNNRQLKKLLREQGFIESVNRITKKVEACVKQNNQIDLFEEYFAGEQPEHKIEKISTKTLMLFKDTDNGSFKRSICDISWHPEPSIQKVAVAYGIQRFTQVPENFPLQSYVWDITNPNLPDITLQAASPLTAISYNSKNADQIAGGCYNGIVQIWDVRDKRGSIAASLSSPVEESHRATITSLKWLWAKTGTELITTSTDGKVYQWDIKKFDEPIEKLDIQDLLVGQNGEKSERLVGGTSLEFLADAGPNKFLVGTETGIIISANKKPKKNIELATRYGCESHGRHMGPIYSISRSPPNNRYFLSVGDWSAKIWNDDLKTPIIRTRYHGSYLTDGCFSPMRQGVFFLIRKDGWLDIWDYYFRQNEYAFQYKVSDYALTKIKINYTPNVMQHCNGRYAAIGDANGTVTIMELCESLYTQQPNEKEIIQEAFDRESKKEKALEQQKKQQEKIKNAILEKEKKQATQKAQVKEDTQQKDIELAETEFWELVKKQEQKQQMFDQEPADDYLPDSLPKQQKKVDKSQQQIKPQEDDQQLVQGDAQQVNIDDQQGGLQLDQEKQQDGDNTGLKLDQDAQDTTQQQQQQQQQSESQQGTQLIYAEQVDQNQQNSGNDLALDNQQQSAQNIDDNQNLQQDNQQNVDPQLQQQSQQNIASNQQLANDTQQNDQQQANDNTIQQNDTNAIQQNENADQQNQQQENDGGIGDLLFSKFQELGQQ